MFDDVRAGLEREPFVSGADDIIDLLVRDVPGAEAGFRLLFSSTPFPGSTHRVDWLREEHGGHWYYSPDYDIEGWLCPAMFNYFDDAPECIYIKVEPCKRL